MKKNLAAMAKDFHDIPKVKRDTVKVGIVGEIYVKYSSFGTAFEGVDLAKVTFIVESEDVKETLLRNYPQANIQIR